MTATAIGKPRAKAPTIAHANAASEFTSGCALSSSDMAYSNRSGSVEAATGTKRQRLLPHARCVQKGRTNAART